MVAAQQPLCDFQAQAGTLAWRLGGEEGIEDMWQHVRRDTWTIVDHLDHDPLQFPAHAHLDASSLGDRIQRVVDEIQPYLIKLSPFA